MVTKKKPVNDQSRIYFQCNLVLIELLYVFDDIKNIRTWCDLPIDLHIITETPDNYLDLLREVPVEYVTFQYEQLPEEFEFPKDIKGENA